MDQQQQPQPHPQMPADGQQAQWQAPQPQQQVFAEPQQAQWQAQQPHPQGPADGQQAQWQPQFQQPMPEMHQPQPQQYAHIPQVGTPMPMQTPTTPTPELNAMYGQQNAQPNEQMYGQQDPAQYAPSLHGQHQMPQAPQGFAQQPPQQQAQYVMPMTPEGAAGQYYQQQAAPPNAQNFAYGSNVGTPGPQPGYGPADSAWEQANVTEAKNAAPPFTGFDPASAQQAQAMREQELFNARQRIEALEAERERLETEQALAISAQFAPNDAELEEQFQKQFHEAQLQSINTWEEGLRRHIALQGLGNQQGGGPYVGLHMDVGTPNLQTQFNPPISRAASIVNPASVASPGPSYASVHGGQQMPAASSISGHDAADFAHMQHPAAGGGSMGWTSPPDPSQTPTRGIPPDEALQYQPAEDARRWEAFNQARSASAGTATPSEYTVRSGTGASAAGHGSKGKGRMS